jgi:hypothetical protein
MFMKRLLLVLIAVFVFTFFVRAQDYGTGIGFRGGPGFGLTVKHFFNGRNAFEGLLSTRWHGLEITGLYEIHNMAFGVERLNWYYGFGGHIGFWNGNYPYSYWGKEGVAYTVIGIDGILGLEYNFKQIPLNIGLDWKPMINLAGYSGFWGDDGALSVRFIF